MLTATSVATDVAVASFIVYCVMIGCSIAAAATYELVGRREVAGT